MLHVVSSGVARVPGSLFLGGKRQRHSRGSAPNFQTDLDFWNGLEHNWGGEGAVAPSLPLPLTMPLVVSYCWWVGDWGVTPPPPFTFLLC